MKLLIAFALILTCIQTILANDLHLSAKNPHSDKIFEMLKSRQNHENKVYFESIANLRAYPSADVPPSSPIGLSTTDNWSPAEIIVAILGGFVTLTIGAVLWSKYTKKKIGGTETEEEVPMLESNPKFIRF